MTAPEQMKPGPLTSAASVYALAGAPLTIGWATFSPRISSSCVVGSTLRG
jgi:hypothetical protein